MKLIIDSANIQEIEEIMKLGVSSGITTNPSILNNEKESRYDQILSLLKFQNNDIYVQLLGLDVESMYQDYLDLVTRFSYYIDSIVFKIPIHEVGLKVIHKILSSNPNERILGTTIYSFSQAVTAILAGCESLAIYYNRIKVGGEDPNKVIKDIRSYIDFHDSKTIIVGASFKTSKQIEEALLYGADTCTIAPGLFKEMYFDKKVQRDAEVFEKEHEALINKTK